MRVLVTGAQGFLGRTIAADWLMHDSSAVVLGLGRSPRIEGFAGPASDPGRSGAAQLPPALRAALASPRYSYVQADVLDATSLRRIVQEFRPDVVVHLAARLKEDDAAELVRVNVEGTVNILLATTELSTPPRLLLGSSGAVYGQPDTLPLREDTPFGAASGMYALTRRAAEDAAFLLAKRHGLDVRVARIFNPIGPGLDVRHLPARVAAGLAEIVQGHREPLLHLGPLDSTRDFIDARDVAAALRLVALQGVSGGIYNVGSGCETSVETVVRGLVAAAGLSSQVQLQSSPRAPGDVLRHVADISRLEALGFLPRYALPETLQHLMEWHIVQKSHNHLIQDPPRGRPAAPPPSSAVSRPLEVPTKDYARQYGAIWTTLAPELQRAFFEEEPILGKAVEEFEQAFAARQGSGFYGVGTNSGTDAARMMYQALDLQPGDEVITNAHTFAGVISALLQAGLVPYLVDPSPQTGRLDLARVEAAVGPRTRAVLAVHMHGHPEPVAELATLCARHGLFLLEDCAQAHDATLEHRPVGTFGHAAVFSFHPSKNLGAFGDAGLVLTPDRALAERLKVLRNLGKGDKYRFDAVGPNAKLDTLQAVILKVKLPHLSDWTARRRAIASRYLAGLEDVPTLRLPVVDADADPVWHLFVVHTPHRDVLRAYLAKRGICTGLHYPIAAPDHPGFAAHLSHCGPLPIARQLAAQCLTLPLSHEHTDAEIDHVIQVLRAWNPEGTA